MAGDATALLSWPQERRGGVQGPEGSLLKDLTRCPVALERNHYVEQTGEVTLTTKKGAALHTVERPGPSSLPAPSGTPGPKPDPGAPQNEHHQVPPGWEDWLD
jgi:hypothetical protein